MKTILKLLTMCLALIFIISSCKKNNQDNKDQLTHKYPDPIKSNGLITLKSGVVVEKKGKIFFGRGTFD